MEPVIDSTLSRGFGVPVLQRLRESLAVILNGKIDDGGGAANGSCPRASFKIVGRNGATKRQLHVYMRIDPTGDDQLADGINGLVRSNRKAFADGFNSLAIDKNIGDVIVGCGNDPAVFDDGETIK